MDAIITDPHVDTRFEICILMSVIVPNLENMQGKYGKGTRRSQYNYKPCI